jgi:hypothetical protein
VAIKYKNTQLPKQQFLIKLKMNLLFDPTISLLIFNPKTMRDYACRKTST